MQNSDKMPNPGKIRELSDDIINKIAAGEVIENPASAVKEMVENAIDAKASRIRIHIEDGGKGFIRISDDGEGMGKEDLSLCYLRHTTSKLQKASDLFRIKTNGFRGEAIASIAAISRMTITTRQKNSPEALEIVIEGGKPGEIYSTSAPVGTTFFVENLFFNTPVRRNFLKSSAYEGGKILDHVMRLAMAHPEIRFEYKVGTKDVFLASATDLRGRIAESLGAGIARKMLPLDYTENNIHVKGFVSPPEESLKKRNHQYFFLQNRPIWNAMIHKAAIQAYDPYGKGCPTCVLFLELPDEEYDVNVHPAKREIRFSDENKVFLAVRHAVKNALKKDEFFTADRPTLQILNNNESSKPTVSEFSLPKNESDIANFVSTDNCLPKDCFQTKNLFDNELGKKYTVQGNLFEQNDPIIPFTESDAPPSQEPAKPTPFFIQIGKSFIACEDSEGLLVINQHAAHTRILYEKTLRTLQNQSQIDGQELLFPELMEFSRVEIFILEKSKGTLKKLGFDLEPFGGSSFQLRAVPASLTLKRATIALREFLEALSQNNPTENEILYDVVAKAWANASAIKNGDSLKQEEMAELVTLLFQTEEPSVSPFGKPTLMRLSSDELHKKFRN